MSPACEVPGEVSQVRELVLVRVGTDAQRLVRNTLMADEHPRGAGPFVDHQMRYLVGSAHGWPSAVGFAASVWRLSARDVWMRWDETRRCAHLHRVVGLCRFLIRPHVTCRNLASHVLGRAARAVGEEAVGEDFERLCCFLNSPVGSPRESTALFRRRIGWDDGTSGKPGTVQKGPVSRRRPSWVYFHSKQPGPPQNPLSEAATMGYVKIQPGSPG